MTIDCVDSAGDSADVYDDDVRGSLYTSEWNGRDIDLTAEKAQYLTVINQFFTVALQQLENGHVSVGCRRYESLDLEGHVPVGCRLYETMDEEIDQAQVCFFDQFAKPDFRFAIYHPIDREFALANPVQYKTEIELCKSVFKKLASAAKKCGKKIAKAVKKAAKAAAHAAQKAAEEVSHATNKATDFVKDHKKEILIATAIVVGIAVGAYFLAPLIASGSSGGVAAVASGVAAAGAAAAAGSRKREGDPDSDSSASDPPEPFDLQNTPLGLESFLSQEMQEELIHPMAAILKNNPVPISNSSGQFTIPPELLVLISKGVSEFSNTFITPPFNTTPGAPALNPVPSTQGATHIPDLITVLPFQAGTPIRDAFSTGLAYVGQALNTPPLNRLFGIVNDYIPPIFLPTDTEHIKSCRVQTEGYRHPTLRIGFINGMNTSFKEFISHLYHIKKFAGDLCIEGVYNHSNGIGLDIGEIFLLNYPGTAIGTSDLLLANWAQFHEENRNNPDAKYLQFAHSMGTILTKDALMKAPQEIRDRIIVVAIGPADIIDEGLCYDAFHYATEKDLVHLGKDLHTIATGNFIDEATRTELMEKLKKNKDRLIIVQAHPDTKGMGHDFINPAFDKPKDDRIRIYFELAGESK